MTRLSTLITSLTLLAAACGGETSTPTDTAGADATGVSCRNDSECAQIAVTTCKAATCDSATHRCVIGAVDDGTACTTGAPCIEAQTCLAGTCGGGNKPAPTCGDQECGKDSCGNSCGTCDPGAICTTQFKCTTPVDNCQGLTFEGCCTAAGVTKWCDEDGNLQELDCPNLSEQGQDLGPNCGWIDDQEYYYCTTGDSDASPSPSIPYLCPGESCPDNPCAGRDCGYVCGQSCGTCPNADDYCTADGKCEVNGCGNLTFVGCCAGSYSVYCNENAVIATDCSPGDPPSCGWDGTNEWYDCGLDGADPVNVNPRSCDGFDFPRPPELPDPEVGPEPGPEAMPDEPVVEAMDDTMSGAETVDDADVVEAAPDTAGSR